MKRTTKRNLKRSAATAKVDDAIWIEAHDRRLDLRGLAWVKENRKSFNRLPLRAEKRVRPPVWSLSRCPASARVCFRTDATRLEVRVTNSDCGPMPHMPATGQSGLALYGGEPYRLRPWSVAIPDLLNPHYERVLFENLEPGMREFTLYLPLYKPLEKLELGFNKGAKFEKVTPPALEKPVVFYGSSITQGGCASTPGADYVSTLGRLLNLDVVNLGYSGEGICDPEMAELMGELKASLYVFCSLGNTPVAELPRKLPVFYRLLREKRPETPIVLLSRTGYSQSDHSRSCLALSEAYRDIMIHFYSRMRRAGDRNVHFVDGEALIPFGASCAHVDGCHPADHGFQVMAEHLAPFISKILLADCLTVGRAQPFPAP
jgi:hypothetical protein